MNRKQNAIAGLLCLLFAIGSIGVGWDYGGVWFVLLTLLYPVLIMGLFFVYLFRDQRGSDDTTAKWFLLSLAVTIALLLVSLLVLGSG
jgi:hypothetical protein